MDETTNDRSSIGNEKVTNVRGRSTTLRGGHDPSNLGRLSGKARREKARQRDADAELAKLTLQAQHAVEAQRVLGGRLGDVYAGLLAIATGGQSEHARVSASKLLLDLARAAMAAPDNPDATPLEEMTPEQRVALYERVLARVDGQDTALREDAGDEVEPRDGDQADHADADPRSTRS
jgi:hypothetical protein